MMISDEGDDDFYNNEDELDADEEWELLDKSDRRHPANSWMAQMPEKQAILDFIRDSKIPAGKREIAKHFAIKGKARQELRGVLRKMVEDGDLQPGHRRTFVIGGALPPVTVLIVDQLTGDGELLCRPEKMEDGAEIPFILLTGTKKDAALKPGDRFLGRLNIDADGGYQAKVIKVLSGGNERVLGIYSVVNGRGRLLPTDRKQKHEFHIAKPDANGAKAGDLVLCDLMPGRRFGMRSAKVVDIVGDVDAPGSLSLIAIHEQGIPTKFSEDSLKQAEASEPPVLTDNRTDLRDIPLVTIDGADARDFDDAIFAEPDTDPENEGGWHLLVAIADVAHYVRPGSPLDKDARMRGNSCYFPDRVVPMLPEAISNGLCSLVPDEDRYCMAVHMWIDKRGRKLRHKFVRGLMRSHARLTYTQVQFARDGEEGILDAAIVTDILEPLYGAYAALLRDRNRRGPLDINMQEKRVIIGEDGSVDSIGIREQYDSHRLIENFMVLANVAAAEELERLGQPCMYRVHEDPSDDKIQALSDFLHGMEIPFNRGQGKRPAMFNGVLKAVREQPWEDMVNEMVLRTQMQAYYAPEPPGHFGLALERYAHFTSPIRRYSDLLVHRALIRGLTFGPDGLTPQEAENFKTIGEEISITERRAMTAERNAVDRFTTEYLAAQGDASFAGRVTSVNKFGLFVKMTETGADGLLPVRSLGGDYYFHDEQHHMLVGEESGMTFRLGQRLKVMLREADAVTGSLVLDLDPDQKLTHDGLPPVDGVKNCVADTALRKKLKSGAGAPRHSRGRHRDHKRREKRGRKR